MCHLKRIYRSKNVYLIKATANINRRIQFSKAAENKKLRFNSTAKYILKNGNILVCLLICSSQLFYVYNKIKFPSYIYIQLPNNIFYNAMVVNINKIEN